MDNKPFPTLLPCIMESLSRNKNRCLTIESLCNEIKNVVKDEHTRNFDSLQEAVEFGLKVGIDMGIVVRTNTNLYRVPFNFSAK